jgi:hypothetical protein
VSFVFLTKYYWDIQIRERMKLQVLGHEHTDREKFSKNFGWKLRRNHFEDPSSTPAQPMAHGQHVASA